ncbi:MAG: tetratricopeptide repeat protein [Candidatus Riflebacteria bacterium]|nr:tetratricopeptide repeat protein [Candidatus Riflebacteria bacterium]
MEYDPRHVMTHQNLGVIYRDECDFVQAKMHFNILKDLDTTYSEVVEKEIFRCEEQEFLARMEEEKKLTVKNLESEEDSIIEKALSALIGENYQNALEYAEQILKDSPEDKNALLVKGQALAGIWKNDEALQVFKKVVELFPKEIEAYYQMGIISTNTGNYAQALDYFQKVKSLDAFYPLVDENIESIKRNISTGGQKS